VPQKIPTLKNLVSFPIFAKGEAYSIPAASILRFGFLGEAKYAAPELSSVGGQHTAIKYFEATSRHATF